jgi:hypothetical protein
VREELYHVVLSTVTKAGWLRLNLKPSALDDARCKTYFWQATADDNVAVFVWEVSEHLSDVVVTFPTVPLPSPYLVSGWDFLDFALTNGLVDGGNLDPAPNTGEPDMLTLGDLAIGPTKEQLFAGLKIPSAFFAEAESKLPIVGDE